MRFSRYAALVLLVSEGSCGGGDASPSGPTGPNDAVTPGAVPTTQPTSVATSEPGPPVTQPDPMRDVLLVGNSVAGTVSFIDAKTFANFATVNVVPDLDVRLGEINANVLAALTYATIKQKQKIAHFEPSNGDRFVDDVFLSPDGTKLYVSRSNLGDVVAIDLARSDHPILWRTHVDGAKADHATLSPDGTKLVVSATSVDKANVIDAATGAITGSFATGHFPHQNDYSANGEHIYNGSIGDVSLPHALDAGKGLRQLTVVNAKTLKVERTYAFAKGIRPSVVTADETVMYAQLSYLNGLVKFDLVGGTIVQTSTQPFSAFATANYPTEDDYPHDSAHHGLALSGDGTKLCDAGTIDNTVSIVRTSDLGVEAVIDVGLIPYWSTTSADGKLCFVSLSGADAVSVIDYASAKEIAKVPVGQFPQRSRLGRVPPEVINVLSEL